MRTELSDRLDRARTLDADVYIVEADPLVVELDSESGETYTIIPNTAYCGCNDHRHRNYPCKHLLYCVTDTAVPESVRDAVARGIESEADALVTTAEEREREATSAREQADIWDDAVSVVTDEAVDDADDLIDAMIDNAEDPDVESDDVASIASSVGE